MVGRCTVWRRANETPVILRKDQGFGFGGLVVQRLRPHPMLAEDHHVRLQARHTA